MTVGQNFTEKGITYTVTAVETTEELEARGLNNVARLNREHKIVRHILAKRPKGTKSYMFYQYACGTVRFVTAV